jgi:TPP-dependent pyruvate/acetoin dehydrogenase alpha subunit
MFDAELYRTKEEVEQWRRRDPIASLVAALRSYDLVTEADVARIEAAVAEEMDAAIAVAERGTLEPVADLLRDVYASREEP